MAEDKGKSPTSQPVETTAGPGPAPAVQESEFVSITSRLNHPVTLDYNDEPLIVPPRGLIPNVDPSSLGPLPKGVQLVPNTGKK